MSDYDDYDSGYGTGDYTPEDYGSYNDYGTDDGYSDDYGSGGGTSGGQKQKKRKSSGGGSKVLIGILVAVLVVVGVYVGVSSILGPRRGECTEVIGTVQSGLNNLDPQQVVSVLKPSVRTVLGGALTLGQIATDTDSSELLTEAVNALGGGLMPDDSIDTAEYFKGIEIKPIRYGLPGLTRRVRCRVMYNGTTYSYINITIKKHYGESYIDSVSLAG